MILTPVEFVRLFVLYTLSYIFGDANLHACHTTYTSPNIYCKTQQSYTSLYQLKKGTNKLVICGQALSHCVNYTVRDIVEHWPKDEMDKLTILADCASSVPGFESVGEQFVKDMKELGVNVETSETFEC